LVFENLKMESINTPKNILLLGFFGEIGGEDVGGVFSINVVYYVN